MRDGDEPRPAGDAEGLGELGRVAGALVVGQAEADHLDNAASGGRPTRPVPVRVLHGQPGQRRRLQRVLGAIRGDHDADPDARRGRRVGSRLEHQVQELVQAAERGHVAGGVHLQLHPARSLGGLVEAHLHQQPPHYARVRHLTTCEIVEVLEAVPRARIPVDVEVERRRVEQPVGKVGAVLLREVDQRRVPHPSREVQVQVRLGEQGDAALAGQRIADLAKGEVRAHALGLRCNSRTVHRAQQCTTPAR